MMRYLLVGIAALGLAVPAAAAPARDAIDLSRAVFHNSPNVSAWARTSSLTRVTMRPEGTRDPGVALEFSARATWPDYTPPGWDGPIQYTIWAGINISGVWHVAGVMQMWRTRVATGAPLLSIGPGCAVNNFACNWVYDGRWGAMAGYQPRAGEAMVFFATAGNARGTNTVTSVAERTNVVMLNLPANDNGVFNFAAFSTTTSGDFNGDGVSDYTVFRPSTGFWYSLMRNGSSMRANWGGSADLPVPADYNGDGRTDWAVYRPANGTWYILYVDGSATVRAWGAIGDVPAPADYDGDGRADFAVFRPSNGNWYILYANGGSALRAWGAPGDTPIPGDYDGDGRADVAVYRHSNTTFYVITSSNGAGLAYQWGNSTDIPVPGDYDGDGRTDLALFRPSTATWYVGYIATQTGAQVTYGSLGDVPVPGDFNGDGRTDFAVYRPSTGTWHYSGGTPVAWGLTTDYPILLRR